MRLIHGQAEKWHYLKGTTMGWKHSHQQSTCQHNVIHVAYRPHDRGEYGIRACFSDKQESVKYGYNISPEVCSYAKTAGRSSLPRGSRFTCRSPFSHAAVSWLCQMCCCVSNRSPAVALMQQTHVLILNQIGSHLRLSRLTVEKKTFTGGAIGELTRKLSTCNHQEHLCSDQDL